MKTFFTFLGLLCLFGCRRIDVKFDSQVQNGHSDPIEQYGVSPRLWCEGTNRWDFLSVKRIGLSDDGRDCYTIACALYDRDSAPKIRYQLNEKCADKGSWSTIEERWVAIPQSEFSEFSDSGDAEVRVSFSTATNCVGKAFWVVNLKRGSGTCDIWFFKSDIVNMEKIHIERQDGE